MGYKVAVIGATGVIGRELLRVLSESGLPVDGVVALASGRAVGQQVSLGERQVLKVQSLERFDFAGWDLVLSGAGAAVASVQVPRAAAAGCLVVDTSSRFRMEPDVPLVVAEVNAHALARAARRRIVACPAPVVVPLVLSLRPLHERFGVRRVVASTYQPVSDVGREGMDELFTTTKASFVNDSAKPEQFTKPIAFNVIPHIDRFLEDGATAEEWALAVETRKILAPEVQVFATCVRVPVFVGQAMALSVELDRPANLGEVRDLLRAAPGVVVSDTREDGGYITPQESAGEDAVYISRLRRDPTVPHGLGFWCASDNLRRGTALTALGIAEAAAETGLLDAAASPH